MTRRHFLLASAATLAAQPSDRIIDIHQHTNYHGRTDTPENVNYDTLADGVRLCEGIVRRLDERWLD